MQHRHYGRRTDARAQQDNRVVARAQSKASAGCADIEDVTFLHTSAQKRTSNPIRFALNADAETVGSGQVGQ